MRRAWNVKRILSSVLVALVVAARAASAQAPAPPRPAPPPAQVAPAGVALPGDYVIGPDDSLSVIYWNNQEMSRDVVVRPDGKISLPLLNDVVAVGLTPEQLRVKLTEAATKFVEDPNVMVIVKDIKSRMVSITGEVAKSGPYAINGPMTVLQLISLAGGLQEFADKKHISIIRTEKGQPVSYLFNYEEVVKKRKNLKQNILLLPGDQVVVP
ncbi:MAG: polysaccharide biosynthesis/export family protein [Acidobacteriota bacterium]